VVREVGPPSVPADARTTAQPGEERRSDVGHASQERGRRRAAAAGTLDPGPPRLVARGERVHEREDLLEDAGGKSPGEHQVVNLQRPRRLLQRNGKRERQVGRTSRVAGESGMERSKKSGAGKRAERAERPTERRRRSIVSQNALVLSPVKPLEAGETVVPAGGKQACRADMRLACFLPNSIRHPGMQAFGRNPRWRNKVDPQELGFVF